MLSGKYHELFITLHDICLSVWGSGFILCSASRVAHTWEFLENWKWWKSIYFSGFFKKNGGQSSVLFVEPLMPLFLTSGYIYPGFQNQGGSPCLYVSLPDSHLVWYLLTCWSMYLSHTSISGTGTWDQVCGTCLSHYGQDCHFSICLFSILKYLYWQYNIFIVQCLGCCDLGRYGQAFLQNNRSKIAFNPQNTRYVGFLPIL